MKSNNLQRSFCCRIIWLLSKLQISSHLRKWCWSSQKLLQTQNCYTLMVGPQHGPASKWLGRLTGHLLSEDQVFCERWLQSRIVTQHSGISRGWNYCQQGHLLRPYTKYKARRKTKFKFEEIKNRQNERFLESCAFRCCLNP